MSHHSLASCFRSFGHERSCFVNLQGGHKPPTLMQWCRRIPAEVSRMCSGQKGGPSDQSEAFTGDALHLICFDLKISESDAPARHWQMLCTPTKIRDISVQQWISREERFRCERAVVLWSTSCPLTSLEIKTRSPALRGNEVETASVSENNAQDQQSIVRWKVTYITGFLLLLCKHSLCPAGAQDPWTDKISCQRKQEAPARCGSFVCFAWTAYWSVNQSSEHATDELRNRAHGLASSFIACTGSLPGSRLQLFIAISKI